MMAAIYGAHVFPYLHPREALQLLAYDSCQRRLLSAENKCAAVSSGCACR